MPVGPASSRFWLIEPAGSRLHGKFFRKINEEFLGSLLETIADKLGISGADHAVVVSGIDTSDPDHVQVIVSDPGSGEAAATYPMDRFVDAWRNSNCFMVATQEPAPPSLPEMANFDYSLGHLAEVWGMPYDRFLGLADHPEDWDRALDDALALDDGPADPFETADSDVDADGLAWNEDLHGVGHDEETGFDHQDHQDHSDHSDEGLDDPNAGWLS